MALHNRITEVINESGIKPAEVARRVGVSRTSVSLWMSGGTKKIDADNLIALCNLFGVNLLWLQTGKGDKFSQSGKVTMSVSDAIGTTGTHIAEPSPDAFSVKGMEKRRIPVLSNKDAITWKQDFEKFEPEQHQDWLQHPFDAPDNAFALRMSGDSMTTATGESIPNGAMLTVYPGREPENGKVVVVYKKGGTDVLVKQLVIDGPNRYLKSLNPQYAVIPIDDSYEILGVVVLAQAETFNDL